MTQPATLLLGRYDSGGRLRYVGRTHPLSPGQRREVAAAVAAISPPPSPATHPWPMPLPAAWSGQFTAAALTYHQVTPVVVVEIHADTAFEYGRWRHLVWYRAIRTEISIYDVPTHSTVDF